MERSPLGRLPPELRLEIFEYVFAYERLACADGIWRVTRKGERKCRSLMRQLDATLVCKQMRKEMLQLPLLLNDLIFGQEVGEFDPFYEWWNTTSLKGPCTWALNSLAKLTHVLLDSTTFKLHLWAYPGMTEPCKMSEAEWIQLSGTFRALASALGSAKLVVHLHFVLHFKDIQCNYMDPLIWHGETVFEIHAGRCTAANEGMLLLAAMVNEKREQIDNHQKHQEYGHCSINMSNDTLSRQLMEAEQVCLRFMNLAIQANTPDDALFDMSGFKDCLSSGQQELRRDSTRSQNEEGHQRWSNLILRPFTGCAVGS
jgi:hypothetical protein